MYGNISIPPRLSQQVCVFSTHSVEVVGAHVHTQGIDVDRKNILRTLSMVSPPSPISDVTRVFVLHVHAVGS